MNLSNFEREFWEEISNSSLYFIMGVYNRPVSQVRALLAACRELAVDYETYSQTYYMFLDIKCNKF